MLLVILGKSQRTQKNKNTRIKYALFHFPYASSQESDGKQQIS